MATDIFDDEQKVHDEAVAHVKAVKNGESFDFDKYVGLTKEYGRLLKQLRRSTKMADRIATGIYEDNLGIKNIFGRFVPGDVVEGMIAGNVSIQLGGVLRRVTVLFVDIRGFTAFSEVNPPEKVVEMVNRYLNLTSRSIQEYGGMIDKYIGDATMAVFNTPNDLENHTLCAVKAALEMKKGSIKLREEITRDFGVDLQFGIGVNVGEAIVGNMGSDFRMDYTVIGDTVNTAARLEANAQEGQIIISQAVYETVKDHVIVEDLGELTVKNKKDSIHIYELTGLQES
ncbi:MAG: adenylate/guanylate cyclase domain-containing protein [Oscillospiraceae bacterium]|nr:adenylate/guanylate cyclase domain-containing protein [Oscillospiraceae bacterium]